MFKLINYLRGFLDKHVEVLPPPSPIEVLLAIVGKSIATNYSNWEYRGICLYTPETRRSLINRQEELEVKWESVYSTMDSGFHSWTINDIPISSKEGKVIWSLFCDIRNGQLREAEQRKAEELVHRLLEGMKHA